MKTLIAAAAVLWAAPVLAQTPTPMKPTQVSGSITTGFEAIDNSTNSSKLTEYRDLDDELTLPKVTFSVDNRQTGWFMDVSGTSLSRDDRMVLARGGRRGVWRFDIDWTGVPHNFSNKAVTPYVEASPGVLQAPATVPITFKKLGTAAGDTAGVVASDQLVAAYQARYLQPAALATQTDAGRFAFDWFGADALSLGFAYQRRGKTGSKSGYGPIGDRPPRTLNVQFAEPVDHRTSDLTFSAEHQGRGYQVRGEYLYSDFANQIDTLRWQNLYTNAAPGATYDVWDRSVSVYGVRPLPPDNRYQNFTATFGADLPASSRLMATGAYGRFEQDESLLPYSYNVDRLATQTLPRSTAQGEINTVNFMTDYVISPVRRLNVRAFYRRFDLNNETPSSRWVYVTSDTSNLNGTVSYVNKRVSLPTAWDRQNAGAEATLRLPGRTSLLFGYEHEGIVREHREADTGEHILRATFRTRAARGITFEARYLQGLREGDGYNNQVTQEGYWYAPGEATDQNNPALTFDNHPDMRRFDVSDRARRQMDVRVNVTPRDLVAVSAYVRYRKDDFESDVAPSQPLLGTGLAGQNATSPGDQLGRLENSRVRYGVDLFVQPTPRASFNAFVNYDKGEAFDRSLEFNENNKGNPATVQTAELGPWTRAGSQWTADFDDETWSAGLGTTLQVVPERLTLSVDYAVSLASLDLAYGGFGVTNAFGAPFAPNHQFAFSSPPTSKEDLHVVNVRFEIPVGVAALVVGYSYENYTLEDWQLGGEGTWVEALGADTLLRDSSRSFQWGNRLFNLGTYLAPSYEAHVGFVGIRYRF